MIPAPITICAHPKSDTVNVALVGKDEGGREIKPGTCWTTLEGTTVTVFPDTSRQAFRMDLNNDGKYGKKRHDQYTLKDQKTPRTVSVRVY